MSEKKPSLTVIFQISSSSLSPPSCAAAYGSWTINIFNSYFYILMFFTSVSIVYLLLCSFRFWSLLLNNEEKAWTLWKL